MTPLLWRTPKDTDLGVAIAMAAHGDIGNYENIVAGKGTNRSVFVDALNKLTGSPQGSPWCAGAVASWMDKAKAARPRTMAGAVDEWVRWAIANGSWRQAKNYTPQMGDVVVYTNGQKLPAGRYAGQLDGIHMGVVAQPLNRLAIEGNTSMAGFSRDGTHVALKGIDATRVYGYIVPRPVV
jgi:hypothetical protein